MPFRWALGRQETHGQWGSVNDTHAFRLEIWEYGLQGIVAKVVMAIAENDVDRPRGRPAGGREYNIVTKLIGQLIQCFK